MEPLSLHKAIKEAINQFGNEIIYQNRLISILSDYQAFEIKASRTILQALISKGYAEKVYQMDLSKDTNRNLKTMNFVLELAEQGYQENIVRYVLKCIIRALGWTDEEPECIIEEIPVETSTREFLINGVSLVVREVEGGKFSIGATPEQSIYASFDEKPSVEVTISDFLISESLVTQELWCALMSDNPSHFKGSKLPVERVTWHECNEFIEKLNAYTGEDFRLPTEAEWEYAARGGKNSQKTKYSGTDDDHIDEFVWYKHSANVSTHDVNTKKANELGLYDMSGNVSEWCLDWYFNSYALSASQVDPTGPSSGMNKVIRGGSWNDKSINCRVSKRSSLNPAYKSKQIGFRLVLK